MSDLYQQLILEAAEQPKNVGQLDDADYSATASNISCGDEMKVWLKVAEHTRVVQAVGWQGQGCVISQAAMSELSEMIKGKNLQQINQLSQIDVLQLLGLEQISSGRTKCLMLGLDAVKRAVSK